MNASAVFSKFPGVGGRGKTVMLPFGGVIIRVIMSALKKVHKQVAYRLLIDRGKILGDFCLIS